MKSVDKVFAYTLYHFSFYGWVWLLFNLGRGHLGLLESSIMCVQLLILTALARIYHIMAEDRHES